MWWIPPQPAAPVHLTVAEAFPGGRQQRWGLRLCSSMCCIFAIAYEFYNWSCRAVGAARTLIAKALQHAELSSEPVWDSLRKGGLSDRHHCIYTHLDSQMITSPHLVWLESNTMSNQHTKKKKKKVSNYYHGCKSSQLRNWYHEMLGIQKLNYFTYQN